MLLNNLATFLQLHVRYEDEGYFLEHILPSNCHLVRLCGPQSELRTTHSFLTFIGTCPKVIVEMSLIRFRLNLMTSSRRSLVLFGLGFVLIMTFNCFTGIVMYARYHDCDPLSVGHVSKLDKMVPYFVEDIMGHLSGMPGVFISCVFSAALSTLSASINSLSGIVYFDYIKPHIHHTEHKANLIMKLFVFFSGIYCIFGGIAVEKFSSILQIVYSIGGVSFGSVTGVFLLGMLVPRAHGRVSILTALLFQYLFII